MVSTHLENGKTHVKHVLARRAKLAQFRQMFQRVGEIASGTMVLSEIPMRHLWHRQRPSHRTHKGAPRTRMLSLIMLFMYVLSSTSSFVRSATFFLVTSSIQAVSTATMSAAGGRPWPSGSAAAPAYAARAAWTRDGSRRRWRWVNASLSACGAMAGHAAVMARSLSTAVRPVCGVSGAGAGGAGLTGVAGDVGVEVKGVRVVDGPGLPSPRLLCRVYFTVDRVHVHHAGDNPKTTRPLQPAPRIMSSRAKHATPCGHLAQLVARTLRIKDCVRSWVQLPQCPFFFIPTVTDGKRRVTRSIVQRIHYSKRFHACFSYSFAFALRLVGLQNRILA
jgi:hypothetical protein